MNTQDVKKLFDQKKFEEITTQLTDEKLSQIEKEKPAEYYIWRGNAWYNQKNDDKAIADYSKAIEIDPQYALAFYNRGFAQGNIKEYNNAIEDYRKALAIDPNIIGAYVAMSSALRALKKYEDAIKECDKAITIDPNYANAYYNRGLARKEMNIDLVASKQDFKKYLELTADENDIWAKYANYYIQKLDERINDAELSIIIDLIDEIKSMLLIGDSYITHYTSLSTLKHLILDNTKFRISEGNFMNDPSEGQEFFNYLEYKPTANLEKEFCSLYFSPKPFIGSFVTEDKHNDLNMWRFYGKEAGEEAKGCSITIHSKKFIDDINDALPKSEEDFLQYESDINFYWVVYSQSQEFEFYIPKSGDQEKFNELMEELKIKVNSYKCMDKSSLEKYLNSIAFLFKSDVYKNENEVRLVVKGMEFDKQRCKITNPSRVYIELESVKNIVKQITLGPKVEKANAWAAVFHYSYEIDVPEIIISHLPYQ